MSGSGSGARSSRCRSASVRSGRQAGWRFRIVEAGAELVLQNAGDDGDWTDLYSFLPQAAPFVDLETSNWYTSTHPARRS